MLLGPDTSCVLVAEKKGAAWDFTCRVRDYINKRAEEDFAGSKARFIDDVCDEPDLDNEHDRKLTGKWYDVIGRQYGNHVDIINLDVTNFRDGEHMPEITDNVRGKNCFYIHDSNLNPDRWLTQLLTVSDALKNSSAENIMLVLPYTKYNRQDRKTKARVSVTTRVLAGCIDNPENKILTVDIHSKPTEALYRKTIFEALHSYPTVEEYFRLHHPELLSDLVIVSPDVGGGERAEAYAEYLGINEVVIGYKVRSEEDRRIKELRFPTNIKFTGKRILIVDDILDSGGTLIKASEEVRKLGAKEVYAYCTHALFTKGYEDVLASVDKLFIGNTIRQPYMNAFSREYDLIEPEKYKLEVIDFAPLFGEAVYRLNRKISLSKLFKKKKPK